MLILMAAAFAVAADVPMRLLRVDSNITVYLYPHAACRVYHAGAALRMCTAKGDGACTFVQNPFAARAHAGAITRGEDAFVPCWGLNLPLPRLARFFVSCLKR